MLKYFIGILLFFPLHGFASGQERGGTNPSVIKIDVNESYVKNVLVNSNLRILDFVFRHLESKKDKSLEDLFNKKAANGNDIFVLARTVKMNKEIYYGTGCTNSAGEPRSMMAEIPEGKVRVCLTPLVAKLAEDSQITENSLRAKVLAAIAHELSHLITGADETLPEKVQSIAESILLDGNLERGVGENLRRLRDFSKILRPSDIHNGALDLQQTASLCNSLNQLKPLYFASESLREYENFVERSISAEQTHSLLSNLVYQSRLNVCSQNMPSSESVKKFNNAAIKLAVHLHSILPSLEKLSLKLEDQVSPQLAGVKPEMQIVDHSLAQSQSCLSSSEKINEDSYFSICRYDQVIVKDSSALVYEVESTFKDRGSSVLVYNKQLDQRALVPVSGLIKRVNCLSQVWHHKGLEKLVNICSDPLELDYVIKSQNGALERIEIMDIFADGKANIRIKSTGQKISSIYVRQLKLVK